MIQANFTDLEDTKRLIGTLKKDHCYPQYIVSFTACPYKFNRLSELDINRLNNDMTVQVYSFALICQAFIPYTADNRFGKIVVMLSRATKGIQSKNTAEYTTVNMHC